MKTFLVRLALLCLPFTGSAQKEYFYTADLLNVKKDQVQIELLTPEIKESSIIFSFPKAIPGSYTYKDFGRFISEFTALDKKGTKLKLARINDNQYRISNSAALHTIRYKVDDTWDKPHSNFVFQPGGSNIAAGKNFVLNNHAFFGYLEGYKTLPIQIRVKKPDSLYASTHLDVKRGSLEDTLFARDYPYLVDNPIIYAKPDTTSFIQGSTRINVSVYSATGKVKSGQIANWLKPMAAALHNFLDGMPVESYHFLYFFDDPFASQAVRGNGGYGALEHNHSSLYYLPEVPLEHQLKSLVDEVSSHEFLHILTPLNLHSKEISNFDFTNPKMSRHLWLYEGVTEYFAHLVQLQNGIIDEKQFMKNMREKIGQAKRNWNFSMTEMSANVLTENFRPRFESVYNKGALLAFGLDLLIRDKTNDSINLKDVVLAFANKYGPEKPFNDSSFFDEFVAASHPDVRGYIDIYIEGSRPLPLKQFFNLVGYEYEESKLVLGYFIASELRLRYDEIKNIFHFDVSGENALGIKDNDIFYSVDSAVVTDKTLEELWSKYIQNNTTMPRLSIVVLRNGEHVQLTGELFEGHKREHDYLARFESPTEKQIQMLNSIKGKKQQH